MFVNREVPHLKQPASLWQWQKRLLVVLARTASSPVVAFRIRPEWVVELGTRVEI
ncbi:MAG TPA: hypothetical protein VMS64_12140 [Candidatus Methylomirabilis sp.]|nr:hypothetical protein [Candidatus Methylomirabilis sp.]